MLLSATCHQLVLACLQLTNRDRQPMSGSGLEDRLVVYQQSSGVTKLDTCI